MDNQPTYSLTCGNAGFRTSMLEGLVTAYGLQDTYQKNLLDATSPVNEGETADPAAREMTMHTVLSESPQQNAQYRLNTAAKTLLAEPIIPTQTYYVRRFNKIIQHYLGNVPSINPKDLSALSKAQVKKPSARQYLDDAFNENYENLSGMTLIKENMTEHKNSLNLLQNQP